MRKILTTALCIFLFGQLHAQQNCSNPLQVTICPDVCLTNQSNSGMGDDAPAACNIPGEDVLYKIYVANGASALNVSIVNASGSMLLSLEHDVCGTGNCNAITTKGDTNVIFKVSASSYYYLWVDATAITTYDICFGADTGSVFVTIPNTQGNLQFDSSNCATPVFMPAKPFFQVSYDSVFQKFPMTLAPLFVKGTMCITTFFKNTTGIEAVKKFKFSFNPAGYSSVNPAPDTLSGFYNAGNWIATKGINNWTFGFIDSAGTGKGDFANIPNTCLAYTFCFDLIPLSNAPLLTNVDVNITADNFGAGFSGLVSKGCCPLPFTGCLSGMATVGSGSTHAFGFGISDPGSSLPVTLIAFDAIPGKDNVLLKWTTGSEVNNDFFTVERSSEGTAWVEIGRIKGAGNSTMKLFYEYMDDHAPIGTSFYRLKQTDYDSKFSYSPVIEVRIKNSQRISVFPNPATSEIKIKYSGNTDGQVRISISNMLGAIFPVASSINAGEATLKVSELPRGFYLLIIEEGGSLIHREKIVLKN